MTSLQPHYVDTDGSSLDRVNICLNCGAPAAGRFCPECGQETASEPRTFVEFFHGLIVQYLARDGQLWQTLSKLFLVIRLIFVNRRETSPPILRQGSHFFDGGGLMKRFLNSVFALVVLLASSTLFAQAGGSGLVAVAANGKTPSATVSSQAGRSPYFLLFDKQGAFVEAVDNPYKDAANAGIPAVDFLAGKGAKIVVAEGFGAKIAADMKSKGVRPVEFKGAAKDAVHAALGQK